MSTIHQPKSINPQGPATIKKLYRCTPLLFVLLLGSPCKSIAQSSSFTVNPSPLEFCAEPGQSISMIPVALSVASGSVPFVVSNVVSDGNWLVETPSLGTITPDVQNLLNVGVKGSVITLPLGVYSGQVTLASPSGVVGTIGATLTVSPVPCNFSGLPLVTATPGSLFFQVNPGATAAQQILLTNGFPKQIALELDPTPETGIRWLSVSINTGLFVFTRTVNPVFINVDSSGLADGTYHGNVGIIGSNNVSFDIPVTMVVGSGGASAAPVASPSPVNINLPFGTSATRQRIQLKNPNSTPINVSLDTSYGIGHGWITVSPQAQLIEAGGTAVITLSVDPAGLSPGTNDGFVTVDVNSGGAARITIPINVVYGASVGNSTFAVLPGQVQFSYQTGSASLPAAQNLSLTTSATTNYSIQVTGGAGWLAISPVSGTVNAGLPSNISVQVNPSSLPVGSYTAQLVITNMSTGQQQLVPVTLLVSSQSLITASTSGTTFTAQSGSSRVPAPQTIMAISSGTPLAFTTSVTSITGGDFLIVTPAVGVTPQTLTLSLNPSVVSQLTPNTYTANVIVSSPAAANTLNYKVTLNVVDGTLLTASQSSLDFNSASTQVVSIGSTGFPLKYSVSTSSSNCPGFLSAASSADTTPGVAAISVTPAGSSVGVCNGTVSIISSTAANSPLNIPVTLAMSKTPLVAVRPTAINLTVQAGVDAPVQTLLVTSSDGSSPISFKVTSSVATSKGWLTVTPAGGTSPTSLSIALKTAGLPVGTYAGRVDIDSLTVPITVNIVTAATASISPSILTFSQTGTQSLQLTSTIPGILFTTAATTFNSGNWLTVSNNSVITPSGITVNANSSGLNPGTYNGLVVITVPGMANTPLYVPVIMTVTAPATTVSAVVNAASLKSGAIAPGELISIFGSSLGPVQGVSFALTPQGTVPLNLSDTKVSFNGYLAPIIFVRADQINALVPYEIAGAQTANMTVSSNGVTSVPMPLPVASTAPAIFSLGQSGAGQGVIRNADGTLNGPGNPAARGSVIQILATGEGSGSGISTGSVTPLVPPFPKPSADVSVTIGGTPAQILYAGEAPGLISGLLQVNAVVPQDIGAGVQAVVLKIGPNSNESQSITVVVQ